MINESMTPSERIQKAINLEEADRVPVAPVISYDAARYYGITIGEFFWNRKKAEEAYEYTVNKLGGIDFVTIPETAGDFFSPFMSAFSLYYCDWKFPGKGLPENAQPQFSKHTPFIDENGYDSLKEKGIFQFLNFRNAEASDIKKFLETKERDEVYYRKWYDERKINPWYNSFTLSPFQMLALLRGFQNLLVDLYRRPEKVIEVSDWLCDCMIAVAEFQLKDRKEGIIFHAGHQANANNLSPSQFEKFGLPYMRKMVEEFAKDGLITQLHNHGDWTPFLEYFKDFPKKKCILYLDECTDIFKAKEVLGDTMCVMGNLSASLLSFGTPKKVAEVTKKIIDGCAEGGGLIISCENPADTKFENLKALVDTVKKHGVYRA
jgi:uroporphyrinogen-III decarboxylase